MNHDRLESIAGIIAGGFIPTGQRHPIVRSGERRPIAQHVRTAVWYRDRGCCELCGNREPVAGQPWHLDHIIPWSAGGSDDSTNLRVLCETHNQERGNAVDPTERPRRPVTWWCINCFDSQSEPDPYSGLPGWQWNDAGYPISCQTHGWLYPDSTRCRVLTGYRRIHEMTGEVPTWHQRPLIREPFVVAFCAHCGAPALTDLPL